MVWMFGLQLFLSGAFKSVSTVLVGIAPVAGTIALVGWTLQMVMKETNIKNVQNNTNAALIGEDAPRRTEMIVRSQNGKDRVMPTDEVHSIYELAPAFQRAIDPALAEQGFQVYRPTTQVWAHQLTASEVATHFPRGHFISNAGAPVSVGIGQYIVLSFPHGENLSVVDAEKFEDKYHTGTTESIDDQTVSQAETLRQWNSILWREGLVHTKVTKVHAKRMIEEGTIDTVVDGKVESRRSYDQGDYVVCGSRGGRYPMTAQAFSSRYDVSHTDPASDQALAKAGFKLHTAKGKVWSHKLTPKEITEQFPSGRFFGKCKSRALIEHSRLLRHDP